MLKNKKIGEFYNDIIAKGKYEGNYEFNRWFTSASLRLDYFMTYMAINHCLSDIEFDSCFEFGPGPGTWTRLLYRKNPKAEFDLVDISTEMQKQFELEMREKDNVNYNISDIVKYKFSRKYDLFFSSRAIEYLEDKDLFFQKIQSSLVDGGTGIILTKNPEAGIRKVKDDKWQHGGQISVSEFKDQLVRVGFNDIKVYPVIVRVPFFSRFCTWMSEMLFLRIFNQELTRRRLFLAESYVVVFKK